MAVIQGITANVIVDGEPLEEFNEGDDVNEGVDDDFNPDYASSSDDDDQKYVDDQKAQQDLVNPSRPRYCGPSRQVKKYVPSVSDANFEVKVGLSRSRIQRLKSAALVFKLFVDGNRLRSKIWQKKKGDDGFTLTSVTVATPAGPFKKPFVFSEIITRNDHADTADVPEENLARIGTILVRVFRVGEGKRTREMNYEGKKIEGLQTVSEISEQCLKGKTLTHSANLGSGKPLKPDSYHNIYKADYLDGQIPISTFEFKYCSRKALKDMLIIPRTPSPSPAPIPATRIPLPIRTEPHKRPLEELTREELLELARAQEEQLSIKKEVNTLVIKKEVQTLIKNEGQQEVKSEPKTGIKRERDDDDTDEDDVQITMSRSVRFKSAGSKDETIKLESAREDESRVAKISTNSKHVVERNNTIKSEGDVESRRPSNRSKPTIRPQPPGSAETIDLCGDD